MSDNSLICIVYMADNNFMYNDANVRKLRREITNIYFRMHDKFLRQ